MAALCAACPSASAYLVKEPTIVGPGGPVHHSDTGGYEGGFDWVYTQGIDSPEVDAALWEAPLSEGLDQVEAWIPKEIGSTYARYAITHAGHSDEVRLRQSNFANEWVVLGDYAFDASQSSVRSTDAAGYPNEQLAWSAIRWTPIDSLPPNIEVSGGTTTINEPQISGPEGFVVRFVGVGYRGDLLRVYARGATATPVNTATWTVRVPAGEYSVEAFLPQEHAEAEVGYTVHALDGNHTVEISQKSYDDLWVPIGKFEFGAAGASVSSSDATGSKEEEIAWDALRFHLIALEKPQETKTTGREGASEGKPSAIAQVLSPPPAGESLLSPIEPLLDLPPLFLKTGPRYHRRVGPGDTYTLHGILAGPQYALTYDCRPCYVVPPGKKVRLRRHSQIPITHRSTASGPLSKLLGARLYKGTLLLVELSEHGYLPLLYEYALRGNARRPEPRVCAAATAIKGVCPS